MLTLKAIWGWSSRGPGQWSKSLHLVSTFHNFLMDKFVPHCLTQNLNYKRLPPWLINFPFSFLINVDHRGTIQRGLVMDLLLILGNVFVAKERWGWISVCWTWEGLLSTRLELPFMRHTLGWASVWLRWWGWFFYFLFFEWWGSFWNTGSWNPLPEGFSEVELLMVVSWVAWWKFVWAVFWGILWVKLCFLSLAWLVLHQ